MFESVAFAAFVMGIISACSLPLGSITAAVWTPSDRVVAWLMAFGSGALLAALTIDLVGSSLQKGHFYPLALGCILGGLSFMALNQIVNSHGGFLRKSSTTIYYLKKKRQERFRSILGHIERIDVFKDLPAKEMRELVNAVHSREVPKDTLFYRRFDPPDNLYVIEAGEVELLEPQDGDLRPFRSLKPHDAFGRLAFLTGSPHATVAAAKTNVRVWVLERKDFTRILQHCPSLNAGLQAFLRSEKVDTYLRDRHGMNGEQAGNWVEAALENLRDTGRLDAAVAVIRRDKEFAEAADMIRRLPVFRALPKKELQEIGARIFYKEYRRGDSFFHQHEPSDRMFIIERGEVALIDPGKKGESSMTVKDKQVFGGMSFLTSTRHTVSAVAMADTSVWVLRRADFDAILKKAPQFAHQVRDYLQHKEIADYLRHKQQFDPARAADWTSDMVKSMDTGKLLPVAGEVAEEVKAHQGAPVAIWLGIMLDGIPESLVIGSSMIHSPLSMSLLAGLFLSNYPEALSSSVGMRQQGMSFRRVLLMWTSLMVITGIGAALGNLLFEDVSPEMFALVEGIAAGAMLTMIAETMLPEAYLKGGSIIGITTLLGFLAAIFFKTLD